MSYNNLKHEVLYIHVDKTAQYETEEEREAHMKDKVTDPLSDSDIGIDDIPT
ncbi:hypothetical protein Tco_0614390, partial [Tanacetum coccineum]